MDAHTDASAPGRLEVIMASLGKKLRDGAGRHDTARDKTRAAMSEAAAGYFPAADAARRIGEAFMAAARSDRGDGRAVRSKAQARSEYAGIVAWTVAQTERDRAAGKTHQSHQSPPTMPTDISGEFSATRGAYLRWFGEDYDIGGLDAVLCAAAAERLTGDPPWLLAVGGSGVAKTETIAPLAAAGAITVSTISGEAALLSGTPAKSRAKHATGGLLRKIGPPGCWWSRTSRRSCR